MRIALRDTTRDCLDAHQNQSLESWLLSWPAQCILLATCVVWCHSVHEVFRVRLLRCHPSKWPSDSVHVLCPLHGSHMLVLTTAGTT